MQQADFDVNDFGNDQGRKGDENLFVRFYTLPTEDKLASSKAGRPIYKDQIMCGIRVPGNSYENSFKATNHYKNRFPKHFKAFQDRVEMPEEGTPLSEWGIMPETLVKEMTYFNVKTVEQLADLRDNVLEQFSGSVTYKNKAIKWLEMTNVSAKAADMEKELEARDVTISQLQQRLSDLEKTISLASTVDGTVDSSSSTPILNKKRKKVTQSED